MSEQIPDDIAAKAVDVLCEALTAARAKTAQHGIDIVAAAIFAERERWKPAMVYFQRYCQDEADSVEDCAAGKQQHLDAWAFRNVVEASK